jgi:hypothetical protein
MVQRIGLGVCVFIVVGCSGGDLRSGAQGPVASATADDEGGAEVEAGGEQPTVLFRCEEGTIGAYVVTGEFDDQPAEDQMVRISLDSAPRC